MNIRQITDALAHVIFVFIVMIGIIVSGVEAAIDAIKYNIFGIEKPVEPAYSSGVVEISNFSDSYTGGPKIRVVSDRDVFDVNDVSLDLNYGIFPIDQKEKYRGGSLEYLFAFYVCENGYEFELNAETADYKSVRYTYFIFDIPSREAYNDEHSYDLDNGYFYDKIEYKCKVNVKIPSEIFIKNSDSFSIILREYRYDESSSVYIPRGKQYRIEIPYKVLDENTVDLQFENEED